MNAIDVEADQPKAKFVIDKEKAALNGISAETISQGLAISLMAGEVASLLISRMAVRVLYFMAYSPRKLR